MKNSYLHAKALYLRIGKPSWKIRFYGGVSHYVQWGGYSKYLTNNHSFNGRIPVSWLAYSKVVLPGKASNNGQFTPFDTINRYGNHLGSIDFAMEIKLKKNNVLLYYQHPWEDQSGLDGGNMPDGTYGFRWQNRSTEPYHSFRILQFTMELMSTMNQSGPNYPRGNDDYFHNYQYIDGWTHQRRVIGTPFITRWMDADPKWYGLRGPFNNFSMISNNKLKLIHMGMYGSFQSGVKIEILLSQSWNYGRPRSKEPKNSIKQFSSLTSATIPINRINGLEFKLSMSIDKGDWLKPGVAGAISIIKKDWFK
ncbi:hypothetical protein GCM10027347_32270 [Larkinella harenae]